MARAPIARRKRDRRKPTRTRDWRRDKKEQNPKQPRNRMHGPNFKKWCNCKECRYTALRKIKDLDRTERKVDWEEAEEAS